MAYEWMGLYLEDMEAALTGFETELIKNSPLVSIIAFLWFNAKALTTGICIFKQVSVKLRQNLKPNLYRYSPRMVSRRNKCKIDYEHIIPMAITCSSITLYHFYETNSWDKYQKFSLRSTTGICEHWIIIFICIQMIFSAGRVKKNSILNCRIFCEDLECLGIPRNSQLYKLPII